MYNKRLAYLLLYIQRIYIFLNLGSAFLKARMEYVKHNYIHVENLFLNLDSGSIFQDKWFHFYGSFQSELDLFRHEGAFCMQIYYVSKLLRRFMRKGGVHCYTQIFYTDRPIYFIYVKNIYPSVTGGIFLERFLR